MFKQKHELIHCFTGTKRDDDLIVAVEAKSEVRNLDYSQFQTPQIYGLYSVIHAKRLYNEIFTCNFNLKMFPFDSQVCSLALVLDETQQKSIQISPNCPWEIPLKEEITVGEYRVTKIEGYQPMDNNRTKISIMVHITRSFWGTFTTTYLPTFCLLILVQMTFYFPEENFQVRIIDSNLNDQISVS